MTNQKYAEEKRLKRHLDKFKQYNHEETCQNYEMKFYLQVSCEWIGGTH